MKKLILIAMGVVLCSMDAFAQIVYGSGTNNTQYHHFTRDGAGSVVYINQLSSAANHPILRLSSGIANANQNVKFTVENNGYVGIGTITPTSNLTVQGSGSLVGRYDPAKAYLQITNGSHAMLLDNNEITSSQGLYLSSSDTGPTVFRNVSATSEEELMRISADGKVGIGTNAPASKLSIYQSSTMGKKFDPSSAYLELTDGTISMLLDGNEIHSNQHLILGSAYSRDITFNNVDANGSDELMIIKGNGRVGIGTNSPSVGFELKGSGSQWLYVNHDNVGGLRVASSDADRLNVLYRNKSNDLVTLRAGHDHGEIAFIAGGTASERMRINADGSVGIGTLTTGTHKLAVEGSIGAREVTIEATVWPDFVFEEDYDLKSLEEVSAFVSENGHLPDVPSAQQVEENGVDLGSMSEVLLQKIEELTLYMIDQNEQLKAQIEENKSQQLTIEALQKELFELKASIEE